MKQKHPFISVFLGGQCSSKMGIFYVTVM